MSRAQRQTNIHRTGTPQIRVVMISKCASYKPVEFVPMVKVAHGNADPDR